MTKSLPVAVVAAGRLRDYPVLRFNSVVEHLGPVKAPTYRQASRVANTLRAGHPVKRFEDLSPCRTILICSPESRTPRLVADIAASRVQFVVRPRLDQPSIFQGQDPVSTADRRKSVRDYEHGSTFEQTVECRLDQRFFDQLA